MLTQILNQKKEPKVSNSVELFDQKLINKMIGKVREWVTVN